MNRKALRSTCVAWVVFHRKSARCKWRPTSVHDARAKAMRAFTEQCSYGPAGEHRVWKFNLPESP